MTLAMDSNTDGLRHSPNAADSVDADGPTTQKVRQTEAEGPVNITASFKLLVDEIDEGGPSKKSGLNLLRKLSMSSAEGAEELASTLPTNIGRLACRPCRGKSPGNGLRIPSKHQQRSDAMLSPISPRGDGSLFSRRSHQNLAQLCKEAVASGIDPESNHLPRT